MTYLPADIRAVEWYHTLELPGGIVTPGEYDLRRVPDRVAFPGSLTGRRCLDVGTRDGFWAFEMERRGAEEVVGIDLEDFHRLDWPGVPSEPDTQALGRLQARARAFETARAALGSRVMRRDLSVYDLDPDEVGHFDFAFLGTLLLHLRDPVGALAAVRRVLDGPLVVNEVVSLPMTLAHPRTPVAQLVGVTEPFWWIANVAALHRMVEAAGFRVVRRGGPYFMANGATREVPAPRGLAPGARLQRRMLLGLGAPHAWLHAEPSP